MGPWSSGALLFLSSFLISGYSFFVLRKIPPGRTRLFLAVPLLPAFLSLPRLFDPETEPVFVGLTFWALTWIGGFKVLAFCCGRGSLVDSWYTKTYLGFHVALTVPMRLAPLESTPRTGLTQSARTDAKSEFPHLKTLAWFLLKSVTWAMLFHFSLKVYNLPELPLAAEELGYCVSFLLFMAALHCVSCAATLFLAKTHLVAHFEYPFLASSFQDFWSNRWNTVVSLCLRFAVYIPVLEFANSRFLRVKGPPEARTMNSEPEERTMNSSTEARKRNSADEARTMNFAPEAGTMNSSPEARTMSSAPEARAKQASKASKLAAIMATFVVSGLAHELLLVYLGHRVTGEQLLFFLLHGIFACTEGILKSQGLLKDVSPILSSVFVVSVTFWTAHVWFFPAFMRTSIAQGTSMGIARRVMRQAQSWFQ